MQGIHLLLETGHGTTAVFNQLLTCLQEIIINYRYFNFENATSLNDVSSLIYEPNHIYAPIVETELRDVVMAFNLKNYWELTLPTLFKYYDCVNDRIKEQYSQRQKSKHSNKRNGIKSKIIKDILPKLKFDRDAIYLAR